MVPVLTLVFAVIYKVLPDRKTRFRTQLPGALIAAMAWEIYSELFSMYLAGSSSFSYMYGSLVTIAVAMVWLYACMAILFYGAAVNRLISSRPG